MSASSFRLSACYLFVLVGFTDFIQQRPKKQPWAAFYDAIVIRAALRL
jgi:hypothetical protein